MVRVAEESWVSREVFKSTVQVLQRGKDQRSRLVRKPEGFIEEVDLEGWIGFRQLKAELCNT